MSSSHHSSPSNRSNFSSSPNRTNRTGDAYSGNGFSNTNTATNKSLIRSSISAANDDGNSSSMQMNNTIDNNIPSFPLVENVKFEEGYVARVRDNYGWLSPLIGDGEIFFHFSALVDSAFASAASASSSIIRGAEVAFVRSKRQNNNSNIVSTSNEYASRVQLLAPGTVSSEEVLPEREKGIIIRALQGTSNSNRKTGPGNPFNANSQNNNNSNKQQEAYGGKLKLICSGNADGSTSIQLEFAERDLSDRRIELLVGDLVEFNIFIEKRSKRRGACNISLIRPSNADRMRGRVVALKESFGFVSCEQMMEIEEEEKEETTSSNPLRLISSLPSKLFFHFSDYLFGPSSQNPSIGDELEFTLKAETANTDHSLPSPSSNNSSAPPSSNPRYRASRIVKLPAGSIPIDKLSDETYEGFIIKDNQIPNNINNNNKEGENTNSRNSTSFSSSRLLSYVPSRQNAIDSALVSRLNVEYRFPPSAQRDPRQLFFPGDRVSFRLLRSALNGEERPVRINLVEESDSKEGREEGILVSTNSGAGFAFVKRCDDGVEYFLHVTQFTPYSGTETVNRESSSIGNSSNNTSEGNEMALSDLTVSSSSSSSFSPRPRVCPLYDGMEVSFFPYQSSENGKLSALRAYQLKEGTIKKEQLKKTKYRGTVIKIPSEGREQNPNLNSNLGHIRIEEQIKENQLVTLVSRQDSITFTSQDIILQSIPPTTGGLLLLGDRVEFLVAVHRINRTRRACEVFLLSRELTDRSRLFQARVDRIPKKEGNKHTGQPQPGILTILQQIETNGGLKLGSVTVNNNLNNNNNNNSNSNNTTTEPHEEGVTGLSSHVMSGGVEVVEVTASPQPLNLNSSSASPSPTATATSVGIFSFSSSPAAIPSPFDVPTGVSVPFSFSDILNNAFLAKGDLVNCHIAYKYSISGNNLNQPTTSGAADAINAGEIGLASKSPSFSSYSSPPSLISPPFSSSVPNILRAVDIRFLPLRATVSKVDGEGGLLTSLAQLGSAQPDEIFCFLNKDVIQDTTSTNQLMEATTSLSIQLRVGDVVECANMSLDPVKKKRQAKKINRLQRAPQVKQSQANKQKIKTAYNNANTNEGDILDNTNNSNNNNTAAKYQSFSSNITGPTPSSQSQPSQQSLTSPSAVAFARFAKGPDHDNAKGFTKKRSSQSSSTGNLLALTLNNEKQ